ncbi:MAG: cytosine permease, partial [Acidobacteria bacterium]|nr:cytosine permease [Acidobacteriota bacterium]
MNDQEKPPGQKRVFEDYERQRVPAEVRRTWWDLTLVYLGVCIAIPSFLLGSALAVGLGFRDTIGATIWGTLIATPICLLASHVGTCTRVSTALTLRLAFGSSGAKLISAIIAVDMFCWFA